MSPFESTEKLNINESQEKIPVKPDNLEVEQEGGLETPEELEKLVREKMESAEGVIRELSDFEKGVADCNKSINLPADKVAEIAASSDVVKKLEDINERGKSLKKVFEEKMRILLAGFMLAAGSMDANIAGAGVDSKIKSESKLEEVVKQSELNPNETQEENNQNVNRKEKSINKKEGKSKKEIIEDFQKAISEWRKVSEKDWKTKPESDPRPEAEKMRKIIRDHVGSPEYLDKLASEFNGNIKKAKNVQKKRLKNIDTAKTDFVPVDELGFVFYNPDIHDVVLSDKKDKDTDEIGKHEFFHASTKGDLDISKKAKEILRNAYKPSGTDKDKYYSILSEILVRKQKLDLEMEKLKIKKYGEKFTQEHYKKLMDFYKKGKLSKNTREFIETIKPKYFEQIFNEIAENENEKENPSSPV